MHACLPACVCSFEQNCTQAEPDFACPNVQVDARVCIWERCLELVIVHFLDAQAANRTLIISSVKLVQVY